jgi:glycosyltransferase involved in cell wall biosynthesis
MGTPVLLSEDVGLSSFVQENDLGWVTSLDAADVAAALKLAWQDTVKRSRIREEGRKVIEENFSATKLISNYVEEYQKIIDTNSKTTQS